MVDFCYHHIGVSVPSLDAAIEWYGRVLGYSIERRFYITAAKARAAMLSKGSLRVELFEVEGAAPLPDDRRNPPSDLRTHGNKHAAFRIANLDDFLEDMNRKSADIAFVVREAFGRGCFIRDCAGNLIEFVEQDD